MRGLVGAPPLALCLLLLLTAPASAGGGGPAADVDASRLPQPKLIDHGYGPGVEPTRWRKMSRLALNLAGIVPELPVDPVAATQGIFGQPLSWPIVPIHMSLLPDGRVLTYGTTPAGKASGSLVYVLFDPDKGTGPEALSVMPNTTTTDIFCSAQSIMAQTGETLITGGARKVNYSINSTTIFDSSSNAIRAAQPMSYARWYPTLVALPNGDMLTVGGRQDIGVPTTMPEIFSATAGWRTLPLADSIAAFGLAKGNWWYPQAYLTPTGDVFILGHDGAMFRLDPTNSGAITKLAKKVTVAHQSLATVMFQPGRLLSIRNKLEADVIDINGSEPTVRKTSPIDQLRYYGSLTVMADGKVLYNGGSIVINKLGGVAYLGIIWDPATEQWTTTAAAAKPRLYHSSSLLLPDATVLTGGGGPPGPVLNMNAEIYYPPYLFDSSGQLAPRPEIVDSPSSLPAGGSFAVQVGEGTTVSRVTLVRGGSATHNFNPDQRFFALPFTQDGTTLTVDAPADRRVAPPGAYMLFAFDAAGVPSHARMMMAAVEPPPTDPPPDPPTDPTDQPPDDTNNPPADQPTVTPSALRKGR
ncbi:MAG: galactose oxidase early set domain-containing protein [Geminicoccaceae bacterium]